METFSAPRNRAHRHPDPHRITALRTRGAGGCWGRVGNGLAALGCTKGNLAPRPPAQGRPAPPRAARPPAPPPASPREPAREPARAPAAQPRSRGCTRTPHIYAAAPSALTPVPLSHTTTFLPWLSMVRPGEPPPGLACFLLREAPPSALRSSQAGSPRPAAAPSKRDWQPRRPMRIGRRRRALSPRSHPALRPACGAVARSQVSRHLGRGLAGCLRGWPVMERRCAAERGGAASWKARKPPGAPEAGCVTAPRPWRIHLDLFAASRLLRTSSCSCSIARRDAFSLPSFSNGNSLCCQALASNS